MVLLIATQQEAPLPGNWNDEYEVQQSINPRVKKFVLKNFTIFTGKHLC